MMHSMLMSSTFNIITEKRNSNGKQNHVFKQTINHASSFLIKDYGKSYTWTI